MERLVNVRKRHPDQDTEFILEGNFPLPPYIDTISGVTGVASVVQESVSQYRLTVEIGRFFIPRTVFRAVAAALDARPSKFPRRHWHKKGKAKEGSV